MSINPAETAILSMDITYDIVHLYAIKDHELERVARVQEACRAAGIMVIHVHPIEFAEGYPEVGEWASSHEKHIRDRVLKAGEWGRQKDEQGFCKAGHPGNQFHSKIAPRAGEITVVKRHQGLGGTDLPYLLWGHKRHTVVLMGVATSGAVLGFHKQLADMNFDQVILSDLCFDTDRDGAVQRVVMGIFGSLAQVMTSEEFLAAITSAPRGSSKATQTRGR